MRSEDVAHIFGGPLAEMLTEQIPVLAGAEHRQYKRIPAEDFSQEMWAEAIRLKGALRAYWDQGKDGFIRRRLKDAARKLREEDDRYVRACKALEAGYSVDDECFYSTGTIAWALEALTACDLDVADAVQRATSSTDGAGIHIHRSEPGDVDNYQAILIDVLEGLQRLTTGQRRLLTSYYGLNQEDTEDGRWERQSLAGSMGLSENALRVRVHRAMAALQREIGGPNPW